MNKKILLVVDDEVNTPDIRRWITILSTMYTILTAKTGEMGLQLFREEKPNWVLVDQYFIIGHQTMHGERIIEKIREEDPTAQIILIGSGATQHEAEKLNVFLAHKPTDITEVTDFLRKIYEIVQ